MKLSVKDISKLVKKGQDLVGSGKELWDKYGDAVKKAKDVIAANKDGMSVGNTVNALMAEPGQQEVTETVEVDKSALAVEVTEVVPAEEDDTFFDDNLNKLGSVIQNAASGGFTDPEAVSEALKALAEVASDTVKYVAEQETRQEEIRARRDVAISQINATTECIKAYLDKTFDERSTVFSKQFEAVDEALRTGNTDMLAMSLHSINALAAQSPFKALADIGQVKQALTSGATEWDI